MESALDPDLRALLVCPLCRGELRDVQGGLRCDQDRVVFPVADGVPMMVRECAIPDDAGESEHTG